MPVPLETFLKQLTDSGVIAPGKLESFIPPKASPKSAEELARQLVESRHLTKYQAQQIYQGRAKSLILGNYTILDKIGAGGMGQVFKAEHRRMKRVVAIKMLPAAMLKDAAAAARFQREVEAAAKLEHPNIVHANDADEANGVHFLVMQYVDGQDLSALVKKDGPLPVDKAVDYILQAAKGLEFAHKKGVVHRDIKPANLLLDSDGTVKILDMGLARIEAGGDAATQAELTGTGAVMGTVDYMAPEQGLSTKHANAKSDIYSLGCSLFYLLTGKPIYDGETITAKLLAHHTSPVPEVGKVRSGVPAELDAVFKKMVAKAVDDRYQSMSEVIAALERCHVAQSNSPILQPPTVSGSSFEAIAAFTVNPTQTSLEPKKKVALTGGGKRKFNVGAIGTGFLGLVAVAGVIFVVRTSDGTKSQEVTMEPPTKAAEAADQADGPWNTPAFQQWVKDTQALPAEQQVETVSKKLMELNSDFDGKLTPEIVKGTVRGLKFLTDEVVDISPVRALPGLKQLSCAGSYYKGKLSDLSPLKGLPLAKLNCDSTKVTDLSPLQGMPLKVLDISHTELNELTPLQGMKLTDFFCHFTKVTDLSPLRGMPLERFECQGAAVFDLLPLEGMPLKTLNCGETQVSNLSCLKGMRLISLASFHTKVSDLSALHGMPLEELTLFGTQVSDLTPLENCKSLKFVTLWGSKVSPTTVAALRTALPNCKIEWDDPAKSRTPEPAAAGAK